VRQVRDLQREISRLHSKLTQQLDVDLATGLTAKEQQEAPGTTVPSLAKEEEQHPMSCEPVGISGRTATSKPVLQPSRPLQLETLGELMRTPEEAPPLLCPESDASESQWPLLLKVTIISAAFPSSQDRVPSGNTGIYCVLSIPGRPQLLVQTPATDATRKVTWNCETIIDEYTLGDPLEFVLKDHHWLHDEPLCRGTLPSSDFEESGYLGNLELTEPGKGNDEPMAFLSVCVQVTRRRPPIRPRHIWESPDARSRTRLALRRAFTKLSSPLRLSSFGDLRSSQFSHALSPSLFRRTGSLMLDPSSSMRLAWDCIAMTLVCLDVFWLPLQAFDPPQTTMAMIVAWTAAVFWSMDLCATFNTGVFVKGGHLIMDRRQVAWIYLHRWLLPDILIVAADWFAIVKGSTDDGANSTVQAGKYLRVARVIRLLRLLRLAKLRHILFMLEQLIDNERITVALMVCKNLLTILVLNHWIACIWFQLGSARGDGWVHFHHLQDADLEMKYVVSLQWSMAQFTPGASPLQLVTLEERIFAVGVLALALVVSTCFISNITSTLSAMWAMRRDESIQALLLRKFLRQNGISRTLAARVTRYIECVKSLRQHKVHHSRVLQLSYLSGPLHVELQRELREPQLFVHEFFPDYKRSSECAFRELCTMALEQSLFAKTDMVFHNRTPAKFMYFVNMGTLVYRSLGSSHEEHKSKLEAGSWCSENALWMPWHHVGDMKALSDVDVTLLNVAKFGEVTSSDPEVHSFAKVYCRDFIQRLQMAASFDKGSVTDLQLKVHIMGLDGCSPDCQAVSHHASQMLTADAKELTAAEDLEVELLEFANDDSVSQPSSSSPSSPRAVAHLDSPSSPFVPAAGVKGALDSHGLQRGPRSTSADLIGAPSRGIPSRRQHKVWTAG